MWPVGSGLFYAYDSGSDYPPNVSCNRCFQNDLDFVLNSQGGLIRLLITLA